MTPYYQDEAVTIYCGDCREIMPTLDRVPLVVTDPPYGDTSLEWDSRALDWIEGVPTEQVWCFGSLRFWLAAGRVFEHAGWKLAQDIVWEKHNGSGFHADRFKRVHEHAVHWYRGEWSTLRHEVPTTQDATKRTVRRKGRPPHTGHIGSKRYVSEDGGPRLMRSVQQVRSCHGYAVHPTQKPVGIVRPLLQYSCDEGGTVLDPFMGSGTTLVAARESGRQAIGIEIDERYCEEAAKRLAQGVLPLGTDNAQVEFQEGSEE